MKYLNLFSPEEVMREVVAKLDGQFSQDLIYVLMATASSKTCDCPYVCSGDDYVCANFKPKADSEGIYTIDILPSSLTGDHGNDRLIFSLFKRSVCSLYKKTRGVRMQRIAKHKVASVANSSSVTGWVSSGWKFDRKQVLVSPVAPTLSAIADEIVKVLSSMV